MGRRLFRYRKAYSSLLGHLRGFDMMGKFSSVLGKQCSLKCRISLVEYALEEASVKDSL